MKTNTIAKRNLTRDMNELRSYIYDIHKELLTQKPQPNGRIYLHGEVITHAILRKWQEELRQLQLQYNQL